MSIAVVTLTVEWCPPCRSDNHPPHSAVSAFVEVEASSIKTLQA